MKAEDLDLPMQIERRSRLVHQQDLRFAHQRLGDGYQLPLTAGQFAEVAEGRSIDAERGEDVVDFVQFAVVDFPAAEPCLRASRTDS